MCGLVINICYLSSLTLTLQPQNKLGKGEYNYLFSTRLLISKVWLHFQMCQFNRNIGEIKNNDNENKLHSVCENSSMYKEERWPNISYSGFLITSHRHKCNLLHIQSFGNNSHNQFFKKFIHQNIFDVTKVSTVQEG